MGAFRLPVAEHHDQSDSDDHKAQGDGGFPSVARPKRDASSKQAGPEKYESRAQRIEFLNKDR